MAVGARLRWLAAPDLTERLRAVKDAAELTLMRQSARLISEVWTVAVRKLKPGISELAVAAEIEHAMKLQGASAPSFETIVASGARSAWPHARPTPKLLRKNELVVLDQGAILRDYCSDMTRTVFLGRSSRRVRSMYRAVLEAQEAAIAAIRPGVSAASVDAAARKVFKHSGLERYFTHSTGHGLGLEIHEMPRLGRAEETVLERGMVVTVEPGVYIERFGGIRIEDEVLVTSQGAEVSNHRFPGISRTLNGEKTDSQSSIRLPRSRRGSPRNRKATRLHAQTWPRRIRVRAPRLPHKVEETILAFVRIFTRPSSGNRSSFRARHTGATLQLQRQARCRPPAGAQQPRHSMRPLQIPRATKICTS